MSERRAGHRHLVLRADGGGRFGLGHVKRALALARELREHHTVTVRFAVRGDDAARALVRRASFELIEAALPTWDASEESYLLSIAKGHPGAVLVLDHPHAFEPHALSEARRTSRVVVIQGEYEAAWSSDLQVFPAGHHDDAVVERCRQRGSRACLEGLPYVMLSEEATATDALVAAPFVALVAGGSDPGELLPLWASWLTLQPVSLPVLAMRGAGAGYPPLEEHEDARVRMVPFQHPLLFAATLAVTAFGVTAYELLYRGVPTLTAGHSARSTEVSDRFAARHGLTTSLGDGRTIGAERFAHAIEVALGATGLRQRPRAASGIDGLGTQRVAAAIARLFQEAA